MMGRLSDLSDFGRSFLPYLTWRDERTSLVLLQFSVLSGVFTFLIAPLIPWRFVFIALGEAVLLAGHPIAKTLAGEAAPFLQASGKRFGVRAARLLEDDALLDDELDSEIIELERFEVESRQDGAWGPDVTSGGELPKGFKWLKVGDWVVDELYAGGQVDEGEPLRRLFCSPSFDADAPSLSINSGIPIPTPRWPNGTFHATYRERRTSRAGQETKADAPSSQICWFGVIWRTGPFELL